VASPFACCFLFPACEQLREKRRGFRRIDHQKREFFTTSQTTVFLLRTHASTQLTITKALAITTIAATYAAR
jgi:hypothetical protein